MKRHLAPLSLLLAAAVGAPAGAVTAPANPVPATSAAAPAKLPPGFLPPREKIEKPYTNDKCLKNCHELPGFGIGGKDGVLRDLHLDLAAFVKSTHGQKGIECLDCHADADPNFHPRAGLRKVDCRACHSEKPPADAFPPNALEKLSLKGIKPPKPESLNGERWMRTAHAKAWVAGNPAAPFCPDCHTAHYQRPSKDAQSTVNRANLPATCGSCHVDQVLDYDVGGALARFRLAGHGKGDLSERHEIRQCLSCHQGEGAHGEEALTKQACPRCHRVPPKEERNKALVVASLHSRPLASDQPLAGLLRWAYALLVWGGVGAMAVFALFMGFSTLYRSKDG